MKPVTIFLLFLLIAPLFASQDSTFVEKSPKKAVMYSIIPGGGQFYNGKWIKGALIILAESYACYQYVNYRNLYNNNPDNNRYLEKRNKYAWWVGLIYIYNLLDALVDSHLSSFEENIDEFDKPIEENSSQQEETAGE